MLPLLSVGSIALLLTDSSNSKKKSNAVLYMCFICEVKLTDLGNIPSGGLLLNSGFTLNVTPTAIILSETTPQDPLRPEWLAN